MKKALLNKPAYSFIISLVLAALINTFLPFWRTDIFNNLFSFTPNAAVSLVGFSLTSLAIITTITDRGILKSANYHFYELFTQEIVRTIFTLAVFALTVNILEPLRNSNAGQLNYGRFSIFLVRDVYYLMFLFLLISSIFQVYKTVYATQSVALMAVKNPKNNGRL